MSVGCTGEARKRRADLYAEAREAGMSYPQIAKMYGVSYQCVAQACARRGIGHFKPYTKEEVVYPNLRKWMNENEVSRSELIRRMGGLPHSETSSRISAYLRGKRFPLKGTIDRLIKATGLTYELLFEEESE